jgi:uncharacterized protein YoaH (UPF0181 family)
MNEREFCFWLQGLVERGHLTEEDQNHVIERLKEVLKDGKSCGELVFDRVPHPIRPFPETPRPASENVCRS